MGRHSSPSVASDSVDFDASLQEVLHKEFLPNEAQVCAMRSEGSHNIGFGGLGQFSPYVAG